MTFVKVLEMAYLSQNVYDTRKNLPRYMSDWAIPENFRNPYSPTSNFFAELYLKKTNNKIIAAVVAFRGTMPLQHPYNDISDFQMAVLHELPISYQSARVFFHKARWYVRENYPDVPIKLTANMIDALQHQTLSPPNNFY